MHDLEVGFDFLLGIIPVWVRNFLGVLCQLAQAQSSLLIHDPHQTFQKSLFNSLCIMCTQVSLKDSNARFIQVVYKMNNNIQK